jgi:transcriptional regulator with XRE-family HTH domain
MNSGTVFGNKIAAIRKRMGLTQSDLADKIGVSRVAISQFEKGSNRPSPDTLSKLSQVLEEEFTIGKFPLAGIDNNIVVPIIVGNQYNRLKWDYLRRSESDVPTREEEAYGLSNTSYAYESLSLPPIILKPGITRAFPMPGNSMEPSFGDGDLIIATQLQNVDWNTFPKESNSYQVIDTLPMCVVEVETKKDRSIEFGRCGVDASIKSLYCFSDRRGFLPSRINLESIKAIWEFKCFLSQRSQNPAQQLSYRLDDLEREVREIKAESERYPRLKIQLRLLILELGLSMAGLGMDFGDLMQTEKVREYYELEVAPIDQNEEEFASNLFKILQPLIVELAPTVEKDRERKRLENVRQASQLNQAPQMPSASIGEPKPRYQHE